MFLMKRELLPTRKLRADGERIIDDDLRQVSPLLWRHVMICRQYKFDFRRFETAPSLESVAY